MHLPRILHAVVRAALGCCALVLVLSAVAIGPAAVGSSAAGASTGSTITWAEQPQTVPNYIFPFMSLAFFSVSNSEQFQYLMYRPLYWFGQGDQPTLNESLSLADAPAYTNNNTTVTVTLKPYKWSNGETLTAQDVMFWMNMLRAQRKNWAGYVPGAFPDNVTNVTVDSPTQLTFTLNKGYNTTWFTYNELSQITPMPLAWDKTSNSGAPGSGNCSKAAYGTANKACTAVYTYLSKQAGYNPKNPKATNNSLSTYATNKLWQVVDGPWRLKSFDSSGNVTFVPNPTYSGPIKPTIAKFVELPFTSDSAQFNALVGGKVDVGYLPFPDITTATKDALVAGPNNPRLKGKFSIDPLYTWSINYFPYNYNSNGDNKDAGKIFSQLYFRQAMQYLVDQPLYIKKIYRGYAVPTYGPVPITPSNPYTDSTEQSNPYPYSTSKATDILKTHGWKVVKNGTSTCQKPGTKSGECGAGIPKNAKLAFDLTYASGLESTPEIMNAEKSSWAQAGINVTLSSASFDTVIGTATPCPKGCSWQLQNWGAGWVFSPDYYPTGEDIFASGAESNSGNYSDSMADTLIKGTYLTGQSLDSYENYLAEQLPVVYQPNYVTQLTEIKKGLQGVTPQNPLWQINPEEWHWSS